jgi:uncharacterized protein with PQ loop repeat
MSVDVPVAAGAASTVIFALSTLPMLVKAARTKDLASYSLGNILLSNLGNLIHSIYVFHLPAGPIWVLHTFYLISTGLMLLWYVRYTAARRRPQRAPAQDHEEWTVRFQKAPDLKPVAPHVAIMPPCSAAEPAPVHRTTHSSGITSWVVLPKPCQPPPS